MQELQDRVVKVKDSNEQLMEIRKEIVDFHGEMVLLENYSALNYTGTFNFWHINVVFLNKIAYNRHCFLTSELKHAM